MSELTREEIDKRLARLKGRAATAPEAENEPPAPKPEPLFDLDAWLAQQRQPENEPTSDPFIVGEHFNRYGEREALSPYRWPNPNGPMTREAYEAHDREQRLRMDAAQELHKLYPSRRGKTSLWK